MQTFSISPREMIASFWRNRGLIYMLIRRDIASRYRGSILGLIWAFFIPLFMLLVYTFVFGIIFKSRWTSGNSSRVEFALILFIGLIFFNFLSECLVRATGIVLANSNYVKKVVFPLEILPWVICGVALFHAAISIGVWLAFYVIEFGLPHLTALLLPFLFVPFAFLVMGLTWFLASLGVYLRDVSQIIGIVMSVVMFLAPIFYPQSAVPMEYQRFLLINPLTTVISEARDVLYWGALPNAIGFISYCGWGFLIACLGFAWFQKTRKGFSDVL